MKCGVPNPETDFGSNDNRIKISGYSTEKRPLALYISTNLENTGLKDSAFHKKIPILEKVLLASYHMLVRYFVCCLEL